MDGDRGDVRAIVVLVAAASNSLSILVNWTSFGSLAIYKRE
jgi:hypothetical protein